MAKKPQLSNDELHSLRMQVLYLRAHLLTLDRTTEAWDKAFGTDSKAEAKRVRKEIERIRSIPGYDEDCEPYGA